MALGNARWKLQTEGAEIFKFEFGLRPHDSLGSSGIGSPADGKRRIVAPIVLCVGGVPKQSKMAIEAEVENNFVYYLNSKCCRVPLTQPGSFSREREEPGNEVEKIASTRSVFESFLPVHMNKLYRFENAKQALAVDERVVLTSRFNESF